MSGPIELIAEVHFALSARRLVVGPTTVVEESAVDRLARILAQLAVVPDATATAPILTPSDDLTKVPGLVGDLIEWIVRSARRPNRVLALGAAITIVGTLIGRRVAGPTRSATHMYVVGLAGTGVGKQHAIDCSKNALIAAGAIELIGPDAFSSAPAVVKFIKGKQLALCLMDEFGSFLGKINNSQANRYEIEITGVFRKLWGISFGRYDSTATAKDDSKAVDCPALSIYGVSTPEEFYSALKLDDLGNGFLNRFLILETGKRGPEQSPVKGADQVPIVLQMALKRIYQPTPHSFATVGKLDPPTTLKWSKGAEHIYNELSRVMDEEPDAQRNKLRARVPEMAIRLATIRAAGRLSSEVSIEDMVWGKDLALNSSNMLCEGVERHMVITFEFSEICPEILNRMRLRGGTMSRRDVLRSFEKHVKRGLDIELALKHLEDSERIIREEVKPHSGGRKSVVFTLME